MQRSISGVSSVEKVEENEGSWRLKGWSSGVLRWESICSSVRFPFPYPAKLGNSNPTLELSPGAAKVAAEMQRNTQTSGILNP